MEAVKDLNVTLTRYPGGNFVSNYHWLDWVGPAEERVPRLELAWRTMETNQFGTNKFMKFVRAVCTEPYFAVNLGTGTIEEAQLVNVIAPIFTSGEDMFRISKR